MCCIQTFISQINIHFNVIIDNKPVLATGAIGNYYRINGDVDCRQVPCIVGANNGECYNLMTFSLLFLEIITIHL